MKNTMSRALLYGCATVVISGIAIAWANTSKEAGVMTLLSSANMQLRMAHAIPAVDGDGNRLDKRDVMIDDAIMQLDKIARTEPGLVAAVELRGFAHMLQGDFAGAAACYRRAKSCEDCDDEVRDVLTFNEARMLAKAGQRAEALEVFAANKQPLDERFGHQRRLEEAQILQALGRTNEAVDRLDLVMQDEAVMPMSRLQAGRQYLELGLLERAEDALQGIQNEIAISDYYLAQLKLRQGHTDICIELLERAAKARSTEVRRMLREEAEVWSDIAQDVRFQDLSKELPASPGR